ncbi:alginate lyase family protein [Mycobacterium sp. 1274761.0]|uniref:heparinase II/III family protein n=1 Tax=Mycobacterium sp. 1274761.0 TaxID=1834077 RepID=UPI0009EDA2A7|nr:alginate lyase family protein [Mycobacterium sp. 1274761.0]
MSPREILWRLQRACGGVSGNAGSYEQTDQKMLGHPDPDWDASLQRFRQGNGHQALLDQDLAQVISVERPTDVAALIDEAERLVAGERTYFGYPSVNVGEVVDWNYDAVAHYHWPAATSTRIDHRAAPCDPKWIWELNRLQHLPVLAQAWLFTGRSVFADTAFEHLDTWLDQNPVGTGIAWRGAFEAGLRAISVGIALEGLRSSAALTTQRYRRAVLMLNASARYCWRARSRYSSANNHLIGELAGLATVHLLFPELSAPASLFGECMQALSAEAGRQILPDGAGAEQSVSYQMFSAELLSIVVVLLRLRDVTVPPALTAALDRSSQYLSSLVGVHDPDPRYGDDDDAIALRLGAESKRTVRQHLAIVAAATGNASRYSEVTLTAAWFAAALESNIDELVIGVGPPVEEGIHAPDGGLVVLRSGRRRITMDVGPLGYLSIAAHGHADALAVTLSADGRDLIVDPGTASYYGHPEWRTVHRGTHAHPTVCVDGVDQSVIGGPFFWSRHAKTAVHSVDLDRGIVDAEHHGYRRLNDPVTHRRWLIATPGDATVVVIDLIDGRSEHDIVVSWPLAPDLDVTPTQEGHLVDRDGSPVLQISYAATAAINTEQVRADSESQLGWWSDRLEARTPAWLLGARCVVSTPVALLTLLCTEDAGAISDPAIGMDGSTLTATWSEHDCRRGLTIDHLLPRSVVSGPFWRVDKIGSKP